MSRKVLDAMQNMVRLPDLPRNISSCSVPMLVVVDVTLHHTACSPLTNLPAKSFFTPRNTVTAEGGMQEKAVRRRRR